MENFTTKLESIGAGVGIYVSKQHTFGTDAILLAQFANIKPRYRACDFGTGCGIIPLLWCRRKPPKAITAIELQPEACAQLQASVKHNRLDSIIQILNTDLRTLSQDQLPFGTYDLVTMNPPYQPVGSGFESTDPAAKLARHETSCTMHDAAEAAAKLLKFGGYFSVCHRPERLTDILDAMRKNGIEPKRVRFVVNKRGQTPWLVLAEGKKGGNNGVRVLPELALRNENGVYTDEMLAIYGDYGDGTKGAAKREESHE